MGCCLYDFVESTVSMAYKLICSFSGKSLIRAVTFQYSSTFFERQLTKWLTRCTVLLHKLDDSWLHSIWLVDVFCWERSFCNAQGYLAKPSFASLCRTDVPSSKPINYFLYGSTCGYIGVDSTVRKDAATCLLYIEWYRKSIISLNQVMSYRTAMQNTYKSF